MGLVQGGSLRTHKAIMEDGLGLIFVSKSSPYKGPLTSICSIRT